KVLERVPEDKLGWKPHPKSNTIGWNANHIAEIPGWIEMVINQPQWDIAPSGVQQYREPSYPSKQQILEFFDRNVAAARRTIEAATDEHMSQNWTFLFAGETVFTVPRTVAMRSFVMNHLIHHRAILTVYYRLNDIPVPALYGPSGDENVT